MSEKNGPPSHPRIDGERLPPYTVDCLRGGNRIRCRAFPSIPRGLRPLLCRLFSPRVPGIRAHEVPSRRPAMPRTSLLLTLLLCVSASLVARASTREEILPAGTILHCTMDEPNFSSKTAQAGDPVLCHLGSVPAFGHSVFPRGAMLSGHLQDSKDPGHFFGQGWLDLEFDR